MMGSLDDMSIGHSPWRRPRTVVATAILALTVVVTTMPSPAAAVVISPFTVGYHAQLNGGITFAQNTSLTCTSVRDDGVVDVAGCTNARNAVGASTNNNNWMMGYVDVDSDPNTFDSSSSDLVLPSGTSIQKAILYWGARRKGADGKPSVSVPFDRVLVKAPGSGAYVQVVADRVIAPTATQYSDLPYQARADVTSMVQAAGGGSYTVANVAAALGTDRYAGWTLAVVYQDPRKPLRDITLFEGLTVIKKGAASDTITVDGFTAPVAGPVDATVGLVAYDGDRASTGDTASLNGVPMASALSPANNYFNSTVDTFGSHVTSRSPAYLNNLGYDVKVADATGIIPNSARSAKVAVSTSGETVYIGVISTRIDLTAPRFPTVKSVTNMANNDPAEVSNVLEYRLDLTNVGDDPADDVVLSDPTPAGTIYEPGSLEIDGVPVTDAAGDDRGEFATDHVVARVGTGANAVTGGRIGVGVHTVVTFRVVIQPGTEGTTIPNTATLSYRAATLGQVVSGPTNTVGVPVRTADALPDPPGAPSLTVEKLAPDVATAGDSIVYDVIIRNVGTADATGVVLTDPVPAGVSITSATAPCVRGATITCSLGTIVAGGQVALTFEGSVAAGLAGGTVLVNTATATADGVPAVAASASTLVPPTPDIALRKTVVGRLVAGGVGTYRFTVTNGGSAAANDVTVTDPLPAGITLVPNTSCSVDPETPALINCRMGTVAAGATKVLDVQVRIDSTLAGAVVNGATVAATGVEVGQTDNTSEVSTVIVAPQLPATGSGTTGLALAATVTTMLGLLLMASSRRRHAST